MINVMINDSRDDTPSSWRLQASSIIGHMMYHGNRQRHQVPEQQPASPGEPTSSLTAKMMKVVTMVAGMMIIQPSCGPPPAPSATQWSTRTASVVHNRSRPHHPFFVYEERAADQEHESPRKDVQPPGTGPGCWAVHVLPDVIISQPVARTRRDDTGHGDENEPITRYVGQLTSRASSGLARRRTLRALSLPS